jgi:hypothetical protein
MPTLIVVMPAGGPPGTGFRQTSDGGRMMTGHSTGRRLIVAVMAAGAFVLGRHETIAPCRLMSAVC